MPVYPFNVYEVDSSYYFTDAQSLILSKNTLEITDTVDDDLHRTQADDPNNDQTFSFAGESAVTDYTVQYLDFAQVNGTGQEFELYAMEVSFADGSTKYYVMSKDENFKPDIGDDLAVTTFSSFISTDYGSIGAAVCFAEGTSIQTSSGATSVQNISIGDFVQTKDNGLKEVLWIGKRHIHRAELQRFHQLRPVLIRPGYFGDHGPLLLSQQHRVLVTGDQLGLSLSCGEAFIKAKHLAEYVPKAARVANGKTNVSYYHILLEGHEVLISGSIETESMFPGAMALKGISRTDRQHIKRLFPNRPSNQETAIDGFSLARPCLRRKQLEQATVALTKKAS
ncbi:Hint domain-containing protein [Tateyamaria sp. ANG-S1]|uniref:Hint domain-containing protein n=1 Tax=Tateyamaria sp. ANG-S1 TaxID=1577905 RepID=UPI00058027E6|nr:Hint domain-containing protein [Tateyamaria sp. ANG-S1]KIC51758.1 hypothetical protein RA29_00110 [Tateyamaria sp. ANG-S1]